MRINLHTNSFWIHLNIYSCSFKWRRCILKKASSASSLDPSASARVNNTSRNAATFINRETHSAVMFRNRCLQHTFLKFHPNLIEKHFISYHYAHRVLREKTIQSCKTQNGFIWMNIQKQGISHYLIMQKCKMHQYCNIQYNISFPQFLQIEKLRCGMCLTKCTP